MVPPLRATGQAEPKDEAKPSAGLDGCKPGRPASGIRAQTQSSPSRRIRTTLSRAMGNWYSASAGPNDANAGRAPAASKTAADTTPQGSIATSRRKNTPQTRRSRNKTASLRQPRSSASCERTRYQSASLGAVRRAGHSAIRALTSPAQPPAPAGRLRAQVRMLFEIIARFQPKCAENVAAEDAKRTDLLPHIPFAIF